MTSVVQNNVFKTILSFFFCINFFFFYLIPVKTGADMCCFWTQLLFFDIRNSGQSWMYSNSERRFKIKCDYLLLFCLSLCNVDVFLCMVLCNCVVQMFCECVCPCISWDLWTLLLIRDFQAERRETIANSNIIITVKQTALALILTKVLLLYPQLLIISLVNVVIALSHHHCYPCYI